MSFEPAGHAPGQSCILSVYPPTRSYKPQVLELAGPEALWLTVGELRQKSPVGMIRYLRSLRVDRVFLPIEGEDGLALIPVLKILASFVRSRETFVVGPDMALTPVTRGEMAASTFDFARASLLAWTCMRRASADIKSLLRAERIAVARPIRQDVLYLNPNLWFGVKAGGSVGHISGVVNGLMQVSRKVELVSAGGRLQAREGVGYSLLHALAHFGTPWEYNFYRFHYEVVRQVRQIIARRHFGFIYQRLSVCNFSGVTLSREHRLPLIMEYNGSEVWVARNWGKPLRNQRLAELVEEANLRHAHMVVTISDVLRDELLGRGIPAERIVTYPNCIDPEVFDPARFTAGEIGSLRTSHGIADDAIVVTFLGTFGQWHGAGVLAEAARRLLDSHSGWAERHKLHFLFVGDGLKMSDVRAALAQHAGGPRVTLTGLVPQDAAPLYLAASDILVSPHVPNADGSRFFGSPTKLFEYMAMGKAILASDLDQIGEVLAGSLRVGVAPDRTLGSAGAPPAMLAEPGSASQIVDGIKMLAERQDLRTELGANARALALSRYTWRHHVEAILNRARSLGLAADAPSPGA